MKNRESSVKRICAAIAAVCQIVAAVAYALRGGDVLSEFSTAAEVLLILAAVLGAVEFVKPLPLLEYVPYVLTLCAAGSFLREEMDFLANVYTGLDGNMLDAPLIVILTGMVLAILAGAAAVSVRSISVHIIYPGAGSGEAPL